MTIEELPRLMTDSSNKDGNAEAMMDYVISWCLRFAESKYIQEKPILSKYCRYMLGKLIDADVKENTFIKSVVVKKQWHRIDLCVEVLIDEDGIETKHAILIENKYYTTLHDNQHINYKIIFDKEYEGWARTYRIITCYDDPKRVEELYGEDIKDTPYKAYTFYEMLSPELWDVEKGLYRETESDIFNEFWLRWGM